MKGNIIFGANLKLLVIIAIQIILHSCGEKAEDKNDSIEYDGSKQSCSIILPEGVSKDLLQRCKIISHSDNREIYNSSCKLNSISDSLVHTYLMADNNDKVYMLTRVNPLSNKNIVINLESTALSLATLHPLFGPIIGDDYETIINKIKHSSKYNQLCISVENVIKQNKNLFDETNYDIISSLEALYEDVLSDINTESYENAIPVASRKYQTRAPYTNGNLNPVYIYADITNNVLTLRCRGLTPSYYGTVYTPLNGDSTEFSVTSRPDYGGMDIFTPYNLFNLGPASRYEFNLEGEHYFRLRRINEAAIFDLILRLTKSILTTIGIDLGNDTAIQEIATIVANAIKSSGINLVGIDDATFRDWFGVAYEAIIGYLRRNTSYIARNGLLEELRYYAFLLGGSLNIYNKIKGAANAGARIAYSLAAPINIEFCLCYYNGEISSCKYAELYRESGNNQQGKPGEKLKEPLKVYIHTISDDHLDNTQALYHQIKFEVVSGGGTIDPVFPKAGSDNIAETSWTLGDEGEQQVTATIYDVITNKEICQPVHFYASLLDKNADEFCPDANHPHMIDLGLPSGTKWACCNVGANSPSDYGGYFSWGETKTKDIFDMFSYSLWTSLSGLEKKEADLEFEEDGRVYYAKFTAPEYIINTDFDAAKVCWGGDWRMPSKEDFEELINWTHIFPYKFNGVNGLYCFNDGDAMLFFPSGGFKEAGYDENGSKVNINWGDDYYTYLWYGNEKWGFTCLDNSFLDNSFFRMSYPYVGLNIRGVVKTK